jgi:phosphatidylglycerophosphate synthase
VAGGLLVRAGSIIDAVDGDKSRLTGKGSPFGAFLGTVIDWYAHGSAMVDLILWTAKLYDGALVWMIGSRRCWARTR